MTQYLLLNFLMRLFGWFFDEILKAKLTQRLVIVRIDEKYVILLDYIVQEWNYVIML